MIRQPTARSELNEVVQALVKMDRPAAVEILARFNARGESRPAMNTTELTSEDIPAARAAFVEALRKLDAKAAP